MDCPKCKKVTKHHHKHDEVHGIPGTHMDGSERYECCECGYAMFKEEASKQGLEFFVD